MDPGTKKKMSVMSNSCSKRSIQALGLLIEEAFSKEQPFQYPITTLPLSLAISDGSSRQQRNEASILNQIAKDFSLSKSNIMPRNSRWIYHGMTMFHMVAS